MVSESVKIGFFTFEQLPACLSREFQLYFQMTLIQMKTVPDAEFNIQNISKILTIDKCMNPPIN